MIPRPVAKPTVAKPTSFEVPLAKRFVLRTYEEKSGPTWGVELCFVNDKGERVPLCGEPGLADAECARLVGEGMWGYLSGPGDVDSILASEVKGRRPEGDKT